MVLPFSPVLLAVPVGVASAPPPVARLAPPPFYLGGIQVNEANHGAWFSALAQEKMNTVELTAYAHQGDWDSDNLFWDAEAPWVIEEMRGARRRGLHTVFIARVALDSAFPRNRFLWHGRIQPQSDALVDAFFARYTRFVVDWARRCEAEGVDVFAIGSEMNALATTVPALELPALEAYYLDSKKAAERRAAMAAQVGAGEGGAAQMAELEARLAVERGWAEQVTGGGSLAAVNARRRLLDRHWRALIAEVRQVFHGQVIYAANFDQYREVGFWDALDGIGINAYFKLRDRLVAPGDRGGLYGLLLDGWRGVLGEIGAFRRAGGLETKPVFFTEMGFTRRALSTLEPWSDAGFSLVEAPPAGPGQPAPPPRLVVWREQSDDYEERALAVRALYEVHAALPAPLLRGILYWKLSSHEYHLKVESFMVLIGGPGKDPILPELRRFLPAR